MHRVILFNLITIIALSTLACDAPTPERTETAEEATPEPPADPAPPEEEQAAPDPHWVDSRVADAHDRLAQSEAGQLLQKSIDAHGGLQNFFNKGPLHFRFNYRPLDGEPRDSRQLVDTWSSRASHTLVETPEIAFGWDGENAWIAPEDAETPFNARFWALTPYYFVALPFVLADPGVILTKEDDATYNDQRYHLIRATYEPGTGDAPDDFYVLYIHPESFQVHAIRYIVSYPGFFPEGGHSPERFMTYEDQQTIEGITLATTHKTHLFEDGQPGDHITTTEVTELRFVPDAPLSAILPPENARILEGL